jgi:ankyrin repeat protein
MTPLHIAIANKHHNFAKLLLSSKANINDRNAQGQTPLHLAIANNDTTGVKLLLENDADITIENNQKITPLKLAKRLNNPQIITLLQPYESKKEHEEAPSIDLQEQFFKAVTRGDIEELTSLIAQGVNINEIDPEGKALHTAIIKENIALVDLLVKAGTNLNVPDAAGRTPLHVAVILDNPELVLLLTNKETVNAADKHGNTPLHWAVRNNKPALVKILMDSGANPSKRNNQNKTPLDLAQQNPKLIELLQRGVAEPAQEEVPLTEEQKYLKELEALIEESKEKPHEEEAPITPPVPAVVEEPTSPGIPIIPPAPPRLPIYQFPPRKPFTQPKLEGPKWSEPFKWAGGGLLVGKILDYLGIAREPIPQVSNAADLYNRIIMALKSKKYEYAYQLVEKNPQTARALSENMLLKDRLEDFIYEAELSLIKETGETQNTWNPLAQWGRSPLSQPFKSLTKLLAQIENPDQTT